MGFNIISKVKWMNAKRKNTKVQFGESPVSSVVERAYVDQAVLQFLCPSCVQRHQAHEMTSPHNINYIHVNVCRNTYALIFQLNIKEMPERTCS